MAHNKNHCSFCVAARDELATTARGRFLHHLYGLPPALSFNPAASGADLFRTSERYAGDTLTETIIKNATDCDFVESYMRAKP